MCSQHTGLPSQPAILFMRGSCKTPLGCFQERSQNTEDRSQNIGHVAHERVTILNSEYWLLNTALAEPTKEVLQAPHEAIGSSGSGSVSESGSIFRWFSIPTPTPTSMAPSPKWRELIKKVWEADPLLCPKCQKEMRIVSLIDDQTVSERILRHLGLWQQGIRVASGPAPPADWVIEPCYDDATPTTKPIRTRFTRTDHPSRPARFVSFRTPERKPAALGRSGSIPSVQKPLFFWS
jgi:hypothetical protein